MRADEATTLSEMPYRPRIDGKSTINLCLAVIDSVH